MTAPTRVGKAASRTGQAAQKSAQKSSQKSAQKTGQKSGQKTTQKSGQKTEKPRTRSAAAERAYARREERRERSAREPAARRPRQVRQGVEDRRPAAKPKPKPRAKQLHERVSLQRLPLVVVVMSVLATGLAATLWLSIAAVSGSYQLQQGEENLNALSERKERLLREVSSMSSTPEIQRRAEEAGLRPAPSPARLVQQPDGSVIVVGEPKKVTAPQPPADQPAAPPVQGEQPPAGQPPAENQAQQQPPADQQPGAAALAGR
ncbi:hypothetical protein [Saccharopolyspora spinosa]|uniref:Cell division protein FtsL n=1 Tax=Saccharopolyspora spinosa TaxID=60894 RepID=A0A2N3Y9A9_SACSN|nr:hypothetical protein [Saccharopolyspora spinosa]PKW19433.1 hypothetical protein A8926_7600 [Saccharopolyspora spinosa]